MRPSLLIALPLLLAAFFESSAQAAPPGPVWGIARAKDGDSLVVGSTEVRLFGIDAPEFDQTCGKAGTSWSCGSEAAEALSRLVTGREVRCVSRGTDQHGRLLGECSIGATDINRTMVASGYALAYRRYSLAYVGAESSAKAAKRGVWQGTFQMPEAYRSASGFQKDRRQERTASAHPSRPRPTRAASRSAGACNIKGNRNRRGEWIYHVPGMPYYERTRAEDIFCSEAAAQAAGYRRAIVRP